MAHAGGLQPELQKSIDGAVEKQMKHMEAVGVAIGIIRHSKVVYTAGYGFADREAGTPVTVESMFRWASLSKPLTAVAAMQLVEQKRLDLDADVRKLVPEFPDKGGPITTRQLLGHFAGLVHYKNGPIIPTKRDYAVQHPYKDVVLALDLFNASPLVAKPGTKYAYSSHGYILASAAIKRAGKMPYGQQVLERIAKPLGLGLGGLSEELSDALPRFHIGGSIGAGRGTHWRLVYEGKGLKFSDPGKTLALAHFFDAFAAKAFELAVEHVLEERGFSGARHPREASELTDGDLYINVFEVMMMGTLYLQPLVAGGSRAVGASEFENLFMTEVL